MTEAFKNIQQDSIKNHKMTTPNNFRSTIQKDWALFGHTILNPPVVISFAAVFVLMLLKFWVPVGTSLPPTIDVTLTLIVSIFSGLIGASISDGLSKNAETTVLVTRGKSAIRGLRLLLQNIDGVEKRVKRYVSHYNASERKDAYAEDSVKLYFDEIQTRCIELQEDVLNAIEEWQDIIPEAANIKTEIGFISELKDREHELEDEILDLNNSLNKALQQSSTDQREVTELRGNLKQKEKELRETKQLLKWPNSNLTMNKDGYPPFYNGIAMENLIDSPSQLDSISTIVDSVLQQDLGSSILGPLSQQDITSALGPSSRETESTKPEGPA